MLLPRKLQPVRACTKCGSTTNGFYKCSRVSDGKQSKCKQCVRLYQEAHFAAHPERKLRHRQMAANWQKANPQRVVERVRRYQKAHPERCERVRTRRHLTNRRPAWANKFFIAEIYDLARLRTKLLGEKWVVDHVIPLTHPLVCGLHVETNLRVVPQRVNAAKGNSFLIC